MVEADFNRLVAQVCNKNNNEIGYVYKIPDPSIQEICRGALPRPFDLIGTLNGNVFSIESKFIKGLSSFNFKAVKEHQITNLMKVHKSTSKKDYVGYFIAFWEPRSRYEFLYIDAPLIPELIEKGVGSIKKKDLLKFIDAGYMISVKKKNFDITLLKGKLIDADVFRRIIG